MCQFEMWLVWTIINIVVHAAASGFYDSLFFSLEYSSDDETRNEGSLRVHESRRSMLETI